MPEKVANGSTPRIPLYLVLSSDHLTPATGKTLAITISKNGDAFGNPSAGATNATEIASGWYYVDLSATDTGTNGPLIVLGTASSCDNSTIAYNVGVDPANVVQWNGTAVSSPATAGIPDVNVKNINNVVAATPGATGGLFIAGTNAATTANITGNITGNLTGSVGSVTGLTTATIATAIWTDTTGSDFTTSTSPGKIIFTQLGGSFTTTSSSVFSTAALANGPTGGTAPTVSQIATAVWQDATGSDFTTAGSIGKSLFTGGAVPGAATGLFIAGSNADTTANITGNITGNLIGTVSTLTTYTGNTPQTGDSYARIGATGSGLTSLASASSLSTLQTTVNTINTNTTGLPTAANIATTVFHDLTSGSDFTTTGSIGKLLVTDHLTVSSVTGNVGGNVTGSVGSVTGITIKKNTALANFMFYMALASDNKSPATGLTITSTVALDGGSFGATANSATEMSVGWYKINLAAADLNGNTVALQFSGGITADTARFTFATQP
jgi:hypothetical protein